MNNDLRYIRHCVAVDERFAILGLLLPSDYNTYNRAPCNMAVTDRVECSGVC